MSIPPKLLEGTQHQYTIDHLLESRPTAITKEGERQLLCFVVPPWQRDLVWDRSQQVRFIEGIFLGLGTGYYVVHESDYGSDGSVLPMSGYLVDGQQRINAIDLFVRDELPIFDGVLFSDLDAITARRRFLSASFPSVTLAYQEDELKLKQLYERLCFGGTAHNEKDFDRLGLAKSGSPDEPCL